MNSGERDLDMTYIDSLIEKAAKMPIHDSKMICELHNRIQEKYDDWATEACILFQAGQIEGVRELQDSGAVFTLENHCYVAEYLASSALEECGNLDIIAGLNTVIKDIKNDIEELLNRKEKLCL